MQNLHTHTRYSDGSSPPEAYLHAAAGLGLNSLGFSDHSPLPFANTFALREEKLREYCDSILSIKHFATSLPHHPAIFLGLEADFIPGMGHPFRYYRDNFPIDYLIGSVHLVRNGSAGELWFIDGPDPATYDEGLERLFAGDIRQAVTAYYRQINEMIASGGLDVVGHLDKIKMHNRGRLFREDEPWYVRLVDETLEQVKKAGIIAEVNTRGIYKKRSDTHFPGPWVLERMHRLGIPVTIASDAHRPEELAKLFPETAGLLKSVGFRETMVLTARGWIPVPLL